MLVCTIIHSAVVAMWAVVCMHHVLAGKATMEREGRDEKGQCIAAKNTGEYVACAIALSRRLVQLI